LRPARRVEPDRCREKGRTRMTDNLAFMDATAQAELVSSGQVLPRELVDAAVERVEKLNGELNAVITTLFERPGGRSR
jgi:Asp-tRNA(Asn)/Glu-tRNA(Gln) amidotransferase A subunit family amidase